MDGEKVPQPEPGRQIEEAIELFEGILQTSPEDLVALDALSMAHEQSGNLPQARVTLNRLALAIIHQNAYERAPAVLARLRPLAEDDFEALEALHSLEALLAIRNDGVAAPGGAAPMPSDVGGRPRSPAALRREVLHREMDLAWKLHEAGVFRQEDYASVVDDLSRLIADTRQQVVSLQHVLVDRAFPGLSRVRQYMADNSKHPFIELDNFEPQEIDIDNLTKEVMLQQGALPFDKIGHELMVALLNPLDESLPADLRRQAGRPCHFYFVRSEAFDAALKKLQGEAPAHA